MKFASKSLISENQANLCCERSEENFLYSVEKKAIWRFIFFTQDLWFIAMTSSIWTLMKVSRIISPGPIRIRPYKNRFRLFNLHKYIESQVCEGMIFTEAYRKVRKLTEGQNFSPAAIYGFLIGILYFCAYITQRWVTELRETFILFIDW